MFQNLEQLPNDPLFAVLAAYRADTNPDKVDLSVGVLMDDTATPFVLPSVQRATRAMDVSNFSYLSLQGHESFLQSTAELFFGTSQTENLAMQQVCGGTHACFVFSELAKQDRPRTVFIGTPTWGNHFTLFRSHNIQRFEHLDTNGLVSIENYKTVIQKANPGDILVLQGGSAHNPTGLNLSLSELKIIAPLIEEKSLIVYVDFAYLGLGDGIEKDSNWLQYLNQNLTDIAVGVSYSKSGTLYRQRTGALYVKTNKKDLVESNLQNLIRGSISNAPAFGAEIMSMIFNDDIDSWKNELESARSDLVSRRKQFCEALALDLPALQNGKGMFGLLPLNKNQIAELKEKYAIYIPDNGRISFGGMAPNKIQYLAEKIRNIL